VPKKERGEKKRREGGPPSRLTLVIQLEQEKKVIQAKVPPGEGGGEEYRILQNFFPIRTRLPLTTREKKKKERGTAQYFRRGEGCVERAFASTDRPRWPRRKWEEPKEQRKGGKEKEPRFFVRQKMGRAWGEKEGKERKFVRRLIVGGKERKDKKKKDRKKEKRESRKICFTREEREGPTKRKGQKCLVME